MTKQEAIDHYGGAQKLADALGISFQAVYAWPEIPLGRQYQLQVMTGGKLQAEQKRA